MNTDQPTPQEETNWIPVNRGYPLKGHKVEAKYEGVYDSRIVTYWEDMGGNSHFGAINEADGKGSQPATHWRYLPDDQRFLDRCHKIIDEHKNQPATQPEPAKSFCVDHKLKLIELGYGSVEGFSQLPTSSKTNCFLCNNSIIPYRPTTEPAKDEWRAEVSGEGWSIYDQFNMWVCNCANEAIAKQIVEDHNFMNGARRDDVFEKMVDENHRMGLALKDLRAELEQARAKIGEQEETLSELQDTFRKMTDNSFKQGELIGQLRAKVEGLEKWRKWANHKGDCAANSNDNCDCGFQDFCDQQP